MKKFNKTRVSTIKKLTMKDGQTYFLKDVKETEEGLRAKWIYWDTGREIKEGVKWAGNYIFPYKHDPNRHISRDWTIDTIEDYWEES